MREISTRGLVFERRGSGPAVLFLHGWCLNRRLWTYEEERLARRYDVITPDLAGFGRSDGLDGPYDLDRYAADVDALAEELELESVVVVGFAFGAAVAMRLAAGGHDRVAGLVLLGIPSGALFPADRLAKVMRRDWPEYCRRSARAICRHEHSDATFAWLTEMFRATPLPVALETAELLRRFEPVELAGDLRVPTLYVHGRDDDISPTSVPQACCDVASEARLEVIDDCGHLMLLDQRERFQQVLDDFLTETTTRGSDGER